MSSVLDALEADSPTVSQETENEPEPDPMEVEMNGINETKPTIRNGVGNDDPLEDDKKKEDSRKEKELEKPDILAKPKRRTSEASSKATATPPTKRPRRSVATKKDEKAKEVDKKVEEKPKGTPKKQTKKEIKPKSTPKSTPKKETRKESEDVVEEFLDCEYLKGEIVAVRNEDSGFYLAESVANITEEDLSKSETFKVQWLDVTEDEDVFVRSYHDLVDHRTVICQLVKLKKESSGRWRIGKEMKKKVMKRLNRALEGNPLTSSDDSDKEDDITEVRLSSSEKPTKKFHKKSSKGKKSSSFARTPVGPPKPYLAKIPLSERPRPGLTMAADSSPPKPKKKSDTPRRSPKPGKSGSTVVNQKKAYNAAGQHRRGRPPIHDTEYIRNSADNHEEGPSIQYEDNQPTPIGSSVSEPDQELDLVHVENQVNPDANLKPNATIQTVEHDPAFTAAGNPFNLPKEVLAIKPMLQRDFDSLQKIIETAELQGFRGPDCPNTVLHYALQSNDEEFLKPILAQLDQKHEQTQPKTLLSKFIPEKSTDEERGNRGLIRPMVWGVDWTDKDVAAEIAAYACSVGCTPDVLEILMNHYPKIDGTTMKQLLLERVYIALENGHTIAAHFLVETATMSKNCGINFSDLQLNTLRHTKDKDHPFNIKISVPQIRKKEVVNQRITAMHTAASNPNGGFLGRMLMCIPDAVSNSDERGRKPIHYAATATSIEPLQVLMSEKSRLICIDDPDKYGVTPLMLASKHGRMNNSTVILDKAKKMGDNNVKFIINRGDHNNYSPVHYAAENGHATQVDFLISHGADCDKHLSIKKRRLTPLMLSARAGHQKSVNTLIRSGAKIEKRDSLERTALMHAAANGHYPIVALLLNKGSDPNNVDVSGNNALHYAAAYGWYHVVQLLLQGSASTDVVNSERLSPLAVALLKGNDDIAKLLFNQGADANVNDDQKRTLLMGLVAHLPDDDVSERINYILQQFSASTSAQDIHGLTVLHHLAQVKTDNTDDLIATAKLFTGHGCDPNAKDFNHRSSLFHAAKAENIALMDMLINQSGAKCPDPRAHDEKGDNFMHNMVRMWLNPKIVELVKNLATQSPTQVADLCGQKSRSGFTPLLLAAQLMSKDAGDRATLAEQGSALVDTLIRIGKSDPSTAVSKAKSSKMAHKEEGNTCSHYLAGGPSLRILKALLEHKPRLECFDSEGVTPLTAALRANKSNSAIALLEAGARVDFATHTPEKHKFNLSPLIFACKSHGDEVDLMPALKLMLEKTDNVNSVPTCPDSGMTPLMFACTASKDSRLVSMLLKKGAEINAKDSKQRTALHHAVIAAEIGKHVSEIIEQLLEAGADPVASDILGQTPLHLIFEKPGHDPMAMLSMITDKMSSINLIDNHERTALHAASEIGAMCCIIHLVKRNADINAKDKDGNSPIALAIKNGHEAATAVLAQLGADLRVPVVYVPKLSVDESKDQYWTNRKAKPVPKIESKPAIEVVIQHKWLNIMTWMVSFLFDNDPKMEVDDAASSLTFVNVLEAAAIVGDFETFKVLVRQQKTDTELNRVNNSNQTLLHILAIHSFTKPDQVKDIADLLIKKGVEVDATDKFGVTALHYAAYNKCDALVEVIMRTPDSSNLLDLFDDSGRSPVVSLFWNEHMNDSASTRILTEFIGAMGDMSGITLSPVVSLPKVSGLTFVDDTNRIAFYQSPADDDHYKITPLHRAIYADAGRIVDKLLSIEVDINTQCPACSSMTPIMLAVENNNIGAVRRLLECDTQPVILSVADDNCRTVLHHLCRQSSWGYWENTDILKLLLEKNISPSEQDVHGKTALDYALEGGSGKLAGVIQDVLNISTDSRKMPTAITAKIDDDITMSDVKSIDFHKDADAILERIFQDESESGKTSPEVDGLSEMADWGQIIEDLTTGLHGDVLLAKVEAKPDGMWVESFTRMQIIGHKLKKQFVLFSRTGNAGEEGEWKITPFTVPENAIREFMKQYKIKTGNDWTSLPEFRRCTKKFALVPFELCARAIATDLEFDLATDIKSTLPEPVQELLNELTHVQFLKEVVNKSAVLDSAIVPFGRLSKVKLQSALERLFDAKDLALAIKETSRKNLLNNQIDTNRMQWFLEQAMNVTFEFQKLLPQPLPILERVRIISDLDKIGQLIAQTRDLLRLEFANQLLLGAQYRINDGNPIDYIYQALNCSIVPLERDSDETKAILSLIENSGESTININHIYKCHRDEDVQALAKSGVDNHRLLWLPASLSDVFYTLGCGVKSPPRREKIFTQKPTRYRKDKTVPDDEPHHIFYEMFNDINCQQFSAECKYAFLCQVALGKNNKVNQMPAVMPAGEYDSLTVAGRDCFADDGKELITPEGAKLSLGPRVQTTQDEALFPSNRIVLYESDKTQVAVRYLVRFSQ